MEYTTVLSVSWEEFGFTFPFGHPVVPGYCTEKQVLPSPTVLMCYFVIHYFSEDCGALYCSPLVYLSVPASVPQYFDSYSLQLIISFNIW